MRKNFSTKQQVDSYLRGLQRETPYYFEADNFEEHAPSLGNIGYTVKKKPKNTEVYLSSKRYLYFRKLKEEAKQCRLCGLKPDNVLDLVVDHDHSSNKIRGVLCVNCNGGLGRFFDNPEWMRKAANWVENFKSAEAVDYTTLKGPQEPLGSSVVRLNG